MITERLHFTVPRGREVRLSLYGVTRHEGELRAQAYLLHAPLRRARTLRGHGFVIAAPNLSTTEEIVFQELRIRVLRSPHG